MEAPPEYGQMWHAADVEVRVLARLRAIISYPILLQYYVVKKYIQSFVLLPTQPRLRWQRVSEAAPTSKWIRVIY